MSFSDISFKNKNLMLLALPMIGFLWLSLSTISQSISTTKEMTLLTELTKLSVVYSELVYELRHYRPTQMRHLVSLKLVKIKRMMLLRTHKMLNIDLRVLPKQLVIYFR